MDTSLNILMEPSFGYADDNGTPYQPTLRETIKELTEVLNPIRFPTHLITASNFIFQLCTAFIFLIFIRKHLSINTALFILCGTAFIGTVYNTIWYHRYCAHVAFEFSRRSYAMLFLWTNPLSFVFREEIYVFPHRVHHERADKARDPYGPHWGWLASLLAPEITQRLNPDLTRDSYHSLVKSIQHIGIPTHSYEWFRKTCCFETLIHYCSRCLISQCFWVGIIAPIGGVPYVTAYYSAIFVSTMLIRDFNWRGHGGSFQKKMRAGLKYGADNLALNQYFYGYIASEWHANHHRYQFSANTGFLSGQIDVAFFIINSMYRIGIVKSFFDAKTLFLERMSATGGKYL